MIYPIKIVRVTSNFGPRTGGFHNGIDFGPAHPGIKGDPILAAESGTVLMSELGKGVNESLGEFILVGHTTVNSLYGHLCQRLVKAGEKVKKGQVIGYMGTTGRSTNVHLHFGVKTKLTKKWVDPAKYLK